MLYCTFAHWVDNWQHQVDNSSEAALRKTGAAILMDIDTYGLEEE